MSISSSLTSATNAASQIMGSGPRDQFLARPVTVKSGENLVIGDAVALEASSGKYRKYNTSGSGGLETALGIIGESVNASAGDLVSFMFVRGNFITAKLGANLDADALGQLNARQVEGETIF